MSVREATNIPNVNIPSSGGAPLTSTDGTQSADAGATQSGTTTSFWDQERQFHAEQSDKRRQMDKTIGDKTVDAASPLDSDGGKQVTDAAGKSGMVVPSKQTLSKVAGAVKGHPLMQGLQNYVSQGLAGDPNFMTSSGVTTAQHMAASVAQDTGLIDPSFAAAFGVGTAAPNTRLASTTSGAAAGAAGAASPGTAASAGTVQNQQLAQTTGEAGDTGTAATVGTQGASQGTTGSAATATAGASSTGAAATSSAPNWLAGNNISAIIMLACAGSMSEDNKIKAGRLNDMQKFNKISAQISGYISNTLQPAQAALDKKTEGETNSGKVAAARVSVDTWSNVDTDDLFQDTKGNFGLQKTVQTERLSNTGLSGALSAAQGWAQTASNNSEQASNRFQATDNQTNQTFTMLTGFLKAINDSNSAIIRNYA